MDLESILEEVDSEFGRAIQQPEDFGFRERTPYKVSLEDPEQEVFEVAVVDFENQNVKVSYISQRAGESYTCVKRDTGLGIAIVESTMNHVHEGGKPRSKGYYLVCEDDIRWKSNAGWEETVHERPINVVESYDDLYRQAVNIDQASEDSQQDDQTVQITEPVPPPKDEF